MKNSSHKAHSQVLNTIGSQTIEKCNYFKGVLSRALAIDKISTTIMAVAGGYFS